MPFAITATNSTGAVSFGKQTAKEALAKYLELQQAGCQRIEVKDNAGRRLTIDELAVLSSKAV